MIIQCAITVRRGVVRYESLIGLEENALRTIMALREVGKGMHICLRPNLYCMAYRVWSLREMQDLMRIGVLGELNMTAQAHLCYIKAMETSLLLHDTLKNDMVAYKKALEHHKRKKGTYENALTQHRLLPH